MVGGWVVEVVWWTLAKLWRPISWIMGVAALLQVAHALVADSFEAWLGPVRTVGMGVVLLLFLVHVRHPWEQLSPEARLKRAKGPFAPRSQLGPGNPRELGMLALMRRGRRPPGR